MSTGPTPATRDQVLARDQWRCVSCRRCIYEIGYSIHHRVCRGMGGSKDPALNLPSNLLTLCGSGTTGCHGWLEAHPTYARGWGYRLYRGTVASSQWVYTADGNALFLDDGTVQYPPPPKVSPEHLAQLAADCEKARLQRMGAA